MLTNNSNTEAAEATFEQRNETKVTNDHPDSSSELHVYDEQCAFLPAIIISDHLFCSLLCLLLYVGTLNCVLFLVLHSIHHQIAVYIEGIPMFHFQIDYIEAMFSILQTCLIFRF